MSNQYLPEGRLLDTVENQNTCASLKGIQAAKEQGLIVEGRAILCTAEHDLLVSFGPFQGFIPREEAAIGIREGTTREIAILSKVGKPVSFMVEEIDLTGPAPSFILSRRRAQEACLNYLLCQAPRRSILPATVTHLENFGAFVDIGCGLPSMIGIENISISRISHAGCRFQLGQEIFALLTGTDLEQGRIFLSHKELLGTWDENADQFSPGMTVPGYVRGLKDYGAFIELAPNLAGLADRVDGLQENDRVAVYIKSILPEKMKIKLSILHKLEQEPCPPPLRYYQYQGQLLNWSYAPRYPVTCP